MLTLPLFLRFTVASIGWHGVAIAVSIVLVAGCGGLLILARELAHEAIVQPIQEPIKHRHVTIRTQTANAPAQEDEPAQMDTADTSREVAATILMQAASEGLTRVRIIEELNPKECWCAPPRTDRAYFLSARECRSICACVNENDPWVSPQVELFPAE